MQSLRVDLYNLINILSYITPQSSMREKVTLSPLTLLTHMVFKRIGTVLGEKKKQH